MSNRAVSELRKVVLKRMTRLGTDLIKIMNELKQLSLVEVANLQDKINSILMFAEKIIKNKGLIWIELNLK